MWAGIFSVLVVPRRTQQGVRSNQLGVIEHHYSDMVLSYIYVKGLAFFCAMFYLIVLCLWPPFLKISGVCVIILTSWFVAYFFFFLTKTKKQINFITYNSIRGISAFRLLFFFFFLDCMFFFLTWAAKCWQQCCSHVGTKASG